MRSFKLAIVLLLSSCTWEQLQPDGFFISGGHTLYDYERINAHWSPEGDMLGSVSDGNSSSIYLGFTWDFSQYKQRRWEVGQYAIRPVPKVEITVPPAQVKVEVPAPPKVDHTHISVDGGQDLEKALTVLGETSWSTVWKICTIIGALSWLIFFVFIARNRIPFLKKWIGDAKKNGKQEQASN